MSKPKIITHKLLKSWSPCIDGFQRFKELFPKGETLENAIKGLVDDGHDDWGFWLFNAARASGLFTDEVSRGYRNSGDSNSGDRNSGDSNSGDRNSGDSNSGYRNSGDRNSGDWNSGRCNSGDWNSGDCNSGRCNSGHRNSGDRNSGHWNSGDSNSGHFNTQTPDEILVFNKPCSRKVWDDAPKPDFIYFDLTYWVDESEMTDTEKAADPGFYARGGQLRKRDYKEAWALAWAGASDRDKQLLKALPNFDAAVFLEISGIDVSA